MPLSRRRGRLCNIRVRFGGTSLFSFVLACGPFMVKKPFQKSRIGRGGLSVTRETQDRETRGRDWWEKLYEPNPW